MQAYNKTNFPSLLYVSLWTWIWLSCMANVKTKQPSLLHVSLWMWTWLSCMANVKTKQPSLLHVSLRTWTWLSCMANVKTTNLPSLPHGSLYPTLRIHRKGLDKPWSRGENEGQNWLLSSYSRGVVFVLMLEWRLGWGGVDSRVKSLSGFLSFS